MSNTLELRCRKCQVPFEILPDDVRCKECRVCGIRFNRDVLRVFAAYESHRMVLEAVLKISLLPDGHATAEPRHDPLENLRRDVEIVELEPDRPAGA